MIETDDVLPCSALAFKKETAFNTLTKAPTMIQLDNQPIDDDLCAIHNQLGPEQPDSIKKQELKTKNVFDTDRKVPKDKQLSSF